MAASSSPNDMFSRDCGILSRKSAPNTEGDGYWTAFGVSVAACVGGNAPSQVHLYTCCVRQNETEGFGKLSDGFAFQDMTMSGNCEKPPFSPPGSAIPKKSVQVRENKRKRVGPIPWQTRLLANTPMGQRKESEPKLLTTDLAGWNLVKSICVPHFLTSLLLAMDACPTTKARYGKVVGKMFVGMTTEETDIAEITVTSIGGSALRSVTGTELVVGLLELYSNMGSDPNKNQ
ncbi:hypothetical protein TRVL_02720 [Trypanosoma vivax]|nr:hypothetical protein TRVL_02720 [Trypanosoma vivax]